VEEETKAMFFERHTFFRKPTFKQCRHAENRHRMPYLYRVFRITEAGKRSSAPDV
jgi:hypothetical protein